MFTLSATFCGLRARLEKDRVGDGAGALSHGARAERPGFEARASKPGRLALTLLFKEVAPDYLIHGLDFLLLEFHGGDAGVELIQELAAGRKSRRQRAGETGVSRRTGPTARPRTAGFLGPQFPADHQLLSQPPVNMCGWSWCRT